MGVSFADANFPPSKVIDKKSEMTLSSSTTVAMAPPRSPWLRAESLRVAATREFEIECRGYCSIVHSKKFTFRRACTKTKIG